MTDHLPVFTIALTLLLLILSVGEWGRMLTP